MLIDLATLKEWLSVVAILLSIGTAIGTWFVTRRKGVDARIDAVETRLDERTDANRERIDGSERRQDRMDTRLVHLEQTVSDMPSREDIHKVELQLSGMTGSLSRIEAVMAGNNEIMKRLETIVSRHEDHLLNGRR